MTPVPFIELESRSALRGRAGRDARVVWLGEDATSPRHFYLGSLPTPRGQIDIGLTASAHGPSPAAMRSSSSDVLLVGHDTTLTWVDLHGTCVLRRHDLGGAFYTFLSQTDEDVLVIYELGAMRVDGRGNVLWNVDTDIVESFGLDSSRMLRLSIMDQPTVIVPISSGRVGAA